MFWCLVAVTLRCRTSREYMLLSACNTQTHKGHSGRHEKARKAVRMVSVGPCGLQCHYCSTA